MNTATLNLINMVMCEINKDVLVSQLFDECQKMHKLGQQLTNGGTEYEQGMGEQNMATEERVQQEEATAHTD